MIPLELLTSGQSGRVCDVSGEARLVSRLDEMGLREGAAVRMVQPGQPCIIALGDHRLTLRAGDDLAVLVEIQASHGN